MRKNWRISAGWRGDEAPSTVAVEPLDGGQRGPQLVAHHGQELGPRPLQLLQRRQVLQGDDHRFDRPGRGKERRGVDQHLHVPAVRHREHHLLGANRLGAVVELLHQRQLGERWVQHAAEALTAKIPDVDRRLVEVDVDQLHAPADRELRDLWLEIIRLATQCFRFTLVPVVEFVLRDLRVA